MNRREFVKHIALLAAGAAALPRQIAAFERYYDANTPNVSNGLIAVDDIWLSGMATRSLPLKVAISKSDIPILELGFNAFGGMLRWAAMPDQKIITLPSQFRWCIAHANVFESEGSEWLNDQFTGHISYIDQESIRQTYIFDRSEGTLL